MKRFIHKKHSIYLQMLLLLLSAAAIALTVFFILDNMTGEMVDHYVETSDYAEIRNDKCIDEFQNYIYSEHLYTRDTQKLAEWVQKQKLLSVSVFKDGVQVFDSNYPDQELWNEEIGLMDYDWISYDTVVFEDGAASVIITGAWRYQLYSFVRVLELAISFFIFLVIVLAGIRRKMAYIRLLSNEVEILESGSLECPITVKGRDELSMLAEGLESMRSSFLESREKEAHILSENQRVLTEMSHDLRTPITAVMLYTEILKKGKYKDKKQAEAYISKIDQKARQIKQRTDQLLAYSLTESRHQIELETGTFTEVFYDLLSESIHYLEKKGFQIETDIRWTNQEIFYHTDYVVRVMDNIVSNVVKYADLRCSIRIQEIEEHGLFGLSFENRIENDDNPAMESTGVGTQSICNMMKEMGGKCSVLNDGDMFRIEICFRKNTAGKERNQNG